VSWSTKLLKIYLPQKKGGKDYASKSVRTNGLEQIVADLLGAAHFAKPLLSFLPRSLFLHPSLAPSLHLGVRPGLASFDAHLPNTQSARERVFLFASACFWVTSECSKLALLFWRSETLSAGTQVTTFFSLSLSRPVEIISRYTVTTLIILRRVLNK